jgi:Ni,Fe-hydrogenase III component G
MNKKTNTFNNIWWLEFSMLSTNNINFKYYYTNNIFFINLTNFFYFFLINKYNTLNTLFYCVDATINQDKNKKFYYVSYQSFFYDLKILCEIQFKNYLQSLSGIYHSHTWVERELKETNKVFFLNLVDTRKLLSNYNYNSTINYNNYNNIINDIKI